MIQPGDTLGDYRVLERIGAGGMATLYLGERIGAAGFARKVAIKVIHPNIAQNERFVRLFIQEAKLVTKIADPHVVHVEALGEANGTLYLAMEYVHGSALSELVRAAAKVGRRLSPELATYIACEIAAGLHAAHETTDERGAPLGVVHRDVSPHNVLVADTGYVKLIDFGIAKVRSASGESTTGTLRGKIGYMAPEQAYGKVVDRRADIYALGVVLWELLAGKRLFQGDDELALLERVRNPVVEPPSRSGGDLVPPELDRAVMRALAADVADRPATAHELRRMLLDALPAAGRIDSNDLKAFVAAVRSETARVERPSIDGGEATLSRPEVAVTEDGLSTITPASRPGAHPFAAAPVPRRRSRATWAIGAIAIAVAIGAGAMLVRPHPVNESAAVAPTAAAVEAAPMSVPPTVDAPPPPPATAQSASTTVPPAVAPPVAPPPAQRRPPPAKSAPAPSATAAPKVKQVGGVPIIVEP